MSKLSALPVLFVGFALVPVAQGLLASFAARAGAWGLVDDPRGRHRHAQPVVVVGGLAVFATWVLGLSWIAASHAGWAGEHARSLAVAAMGTFAALAFGLEDDRRGLSPGVRLAFEFGLAALTVALDPGTRAFCVELGQTLGPISYALTGLGIVAVMNAMNLVDGLDGLAASILTASAGMVALLDLAGGHGSLGAGGAMALALIPGLLAFLISNWSPARAFLGDQGSLACGYCLAVAALNVRVGATRSAADLAWLLPLFGYPALDMLSCVLIRWREGRPMLRGDRSHFHHRLLALGCPESEAALRLVAWHLAILAPLGVLPVIPKAYWPLAPILALAVTTDRLAWLLRAERAHKRGRAAFAGAVSSSSEVSSDRAVAR